MTPAERVSQNLASVRARIDAAAKRAGRDPGGITLVAVTKSVGLDEIRALLSLGVKDLAENRLQPAQPKIEALAAETAAAGAQWHMIGHLQTNKAKQVLQKFTRVDAVDSIKLLECLAQEAKKLGRSAVPILAEVNVSGEAQKFGLAPGDLEAFATRAKALPELDLRGLMTMAPYGDTPEDVEARSRPVFRRLAELLRQANAAGWYGRPLHELSMGMTNDFEIGIEEGATTVRVGTGLFV
ncbi:MAG: YggS family pyridoxal phosphate-dependent enzyme [Planctomycetota bacterium]|nr:YggS family pyridoxal phosphate-dependent enzyme [Planctomycetota bacterium]